MSNIEVQVQIEGGKEPLATSYSDSYENEVLLAVVLGGRLRLSRGTETWRALYSVTTITLVWLFTTVFK